MAHLGPAHGLLAALIHQLPKLFPPNLFDRAAQVALTLETVVDIATGVDAAFGRGKLLPAAILASAKRVLAPQLAANLLKLVDEVARAGPVIDPNCHRTTSKVNYAAEYGTFATAHQHNRGWLSAAGAVANA